MNVEELVQEGVVDYCPRRKTNLGRSPEFHASGVSDDVNERFRPWVFPEDPPDHNIIRYMFCLAVFNV